MKSRVKFVLSSAAVSVIGALAVYGCGSGGSSSVDPVSGAAGGVVVAGGIANSPIDKAPLKATCADGTAGGTGASDKGTYSMTVNCASTNFPVVISIDDTKIDDGNPPMMAGADLQFCTAAETTAGTCDDVPYKASERAPLKVAVEDTTAAANVVNMNAITTLAAQPIEDKIIAGTKPVAADVQTAEANIQTSFGVASVKNSDPVRDSQVARINSQVLEAVAVTKQFSAATVKPEDVMKALAAAANTGTGQALTKTETDGSKSFDIATAQAALTVAAADPALVALKTRIDAINASFTDTKAVEASIRSKGNAVEQVVKVIAALPSMQAFDPLKNTLATGTIAADIKAALAGTGTDNMAARTASVTANLVTQAMAQAITKAKEIEADTSILSGEKGNRKKALFDAAEAIRTSVMNDVTSAAATAALTADQQARAMAQVSMAVNMAGDQMRTAAIGDIVDSSGKSKSGVAGMAQKISSDIAGQIASQTAADFGDINRINPATVMGATVFNTMNTTAAGVVTAMASFTPPTGVDDSVVRAAVNAVMANMATTVDLAAAATQTNIQAAITDMANNLNTALSAQVTVGGVTGTIGEMADDSKLRLLAQTAQTIVGTVPLDFAAPPTLGTVTTTAITDAVNNAVTAVNTVINTTQVSSLDSPTLEPTTLANGIATLGIDSCSAEVKVRDINVGVPIKVTATLDGQPLSLAQPSTSPVYIKLSGGFGKIFANPSGVLVGPVMGEQSFALCVIPGVPGATYALNAQVGSRYDFATNTFVDDTKVKVISFTTETAAVTTPTTVPGTTPTTTDLGATSTTTDLGATTTLPTTPSTSLPTTSSSTTLPTTSSSTTLPTTPSTSSSTTSSSTTSSSTTSSSTTSSSTTTSSTTTTVVSSTPTTTLAGTALSLAATATIEGGKTGVGELDSVNGGVKYTGAPISIGPYVISGLSGATSISTFGTLSAYSTIAINGGTPATSATVNNGDTLIVTVDFAKYSTDYINTNLAGLGFNTLFGPRIRVGTTAINITWGGTDATGGGIWTCADPQGVPPVGNTPCK